jgi:phage tail-like protein
LIDRLGIVNFSEGFSIYFMDVNGTKFHLLLGRADWGRCMSEDGVTLDEIWRTESSGENISTREFHWKDEAEEISLQPRLFQFNSSPKDTKPDLSKRRGGARDRYGNWYLIDETGTKIKVLSIGSNKVSDFYPVEENSCPNEPENDFQPIDLPKKESALSFCGIAVTIDHYLVVGSPDTAGLFVFDLFSTGEPRQIHFREDISFEPFDISARFCGGVVVLDRNNKRFWTLDRTFAAAGELPTLPEGLESAFQPFEKIDDFQPADESEKRRNYYERLPADKFYSNLSADRDPISIEALPDDTVLILNLAQESEDFSIIDRYFRKIKIDELSTVSIKNFAFDDHPGSESPLESFKLRGYDIAFVQGSDEAETRDRLFIVSEEGNQAFAFNLVCSRELLLSPTTELPNKVVNKNFELEPIAEYFPIRLYGGKGLYAVDGRVFYDFGDRWLPLVKQNRARFITEAKLITPILDGKEVNCVWHRLMLEGCIPSETAVEIYSRTSADENDIKHAAWEKEPNLYLRGNGSEIPFSNNFVSKENGKGSWELLLQNANERYLQLSLEFLGNGQRTPRISRLRVYYPRFSYLENYLPSIYREDQQSASFLDRFLANFEGFYTSIEDRIASSQVLFDIRSAPPEALEWLAGWFGIILDPTWDENKRRLFIKRAIDFYQFRGTMRGLRAALRLAIYPCADESFFDAQTLEQKKLDPIRIVERFQTRRTPEIIPSDFVARQNQPQIVQRTVKWTPNQGAGVLNQRYQEMFDEKPNIEFPLVKPEEAEESAIWNSFAISVLGFQPSGAAALERKYWQGFLSVEYQGLISKVNEAHSRNYSSFPDLFLPQGAETNSKLITDWKKFIAKTSGVGRTRKLWQDFLARRYRRIGQLDQVYGTNWDSFEFVSLFDRLPALNPSLGDWYLFESVILPMHSTAHRFTVLIPATIGGNKPDSANQQKAKLELVRRIIELEKPAHTVYDFRYYWNLFRLEEVRLGYDTLLGLGSRDPRLSPELVTGEGFIGESRVGIGQPEKYSSRYVLGARNLIKKQKEEVKK